MQEKGEETVKWMPFPEGRTEQSQSQHQDGLEAAGPALPKARSKLYLRPLLDEPS